MDVSSMRQAGVSPAFDFDFRRGCRGETPLRRMGKMPMLLFNGQVCLVRAAGPEVRPVSENAPACRTIVAKGAFIPIMHPLTHANQRGTFAEAWRIIGRRGHPCARGIPSHRDPRLCRRPSGDMAIHVNSLAAIIATAIRVSGRTIRFRFVLDEPQAAPQRMKGRAIYVFWHEMLLLPAYTHSRQIMPLISRSQDGVIADAVVRRLGGDSIRGSTDGEGRNRGGRRALREMLRQGREHHIGVPITGGITSGRTIPSGVAFAASRAGMPIIPVGIAARKLLSFGPRDRVINVPLWFSQAWYVVGKPMDVPQRMSAAQARAFMQNVQQALQAVQTRAEEYAHAGSSPTPPLTLAQVKAL
jgi:lysophospholipid acyltransferase (LPLAT)-like uncharacterized protein